MASLCATPGQWRSRSNVVEISVSPSLSTSRSKIVEFQRTVVTLLAPPTNELIRANTNCPKIVHRSRRILLFNIRPSETAKRRHGLTAHSAKVVGTEEKGMSVSSVHPGDGQR